VVAGVTSITKQNFRIIVLSFANFAMFAGVTFGTEPIGLIGDFFEGREKTVGMHRTVASFANE
jgi:hypothetical protein